MTQAHLQTHPHVLTIHEDLRYIDVSAESLLQLALVVTTHEDVSLLVLEHVRLQDGAHCLAVIMRLPHYHHTRRVHHDLVFLQHAVVLQAKS